MADEKEVFRSVCYVLWDDTVAKESEVRVGHVVSLTRQFIDMS